MLTEVQDPWKPNSDVVNQQQMKLARVAKYLQYNDISTSGGDVDPDAFQILFYKFKTF